METYKNNNPIDWKQRKIKISRDTNIHIDEFCKSINKDSKFYFLAIFQMLCIRLFNNQCRSIEQKTKKTENKEDKFSVTYQIITKPLQNSSKEYNFSFINLLSQISNSIYEGAKEESSNINIFYFTISAYNEQTEIVIDFQYSCLTNEQVKTFTECFEESLTNLYNQKDTNLAYCNILPHKYVLKIIEENCITSRHLTKPQTFLDLFAKYADKHDIAIVGEDIVQYRQLEKESNLLAIKLQQLGLQQGCRVALILPRSNNFVNFVIAIWKTGGSYVPIDPELPSERIDFMIKDSDCSFVVDTKGIHIRENGITKKNEAYVIYTSGTTGLPKGIAINHSSLMYQINEMVRIQHIGENTRMLQFASCSFDPSIVEIFAPLTKGGRVYITNNNVRHDPLLLAEYIRNNAITNADIPPAVLALMPMAKIPSLKVLFVGGESAQHDILEYWRQGRELFNAYGPTENTINSTLCRLESNFETDDIGVAMPAVTCYVLDNNLNLVPDGFEGELYIGGLQLTDGYINRPELNKKVFVANPFVSENDKKAGLNMRLYKSGDKVIRHNNGHLIFRGRVDNQVKLHGFRIELEEIENILCNNEKVSIAHVRLVDGNIVAYVQINKEISANALRQSISKYLPSYMIPSKWAVTEKFPITLNGKTDFSKLQTMLVSISSENYIAPSDDTEMKLAKLWKEILKIEKIGSTDNFISLGGDSLDVIRLSFLISDYFGVNVNVANLSRCDTLYAMAKMIKEKEKKVIHIEKCPNNTNIPLSPSQFSLWMECKRSEELTIKYNIPILIELKDNTTYFEFCEVFKQCLSAYDALRATFFETSDGLPKMRIEDSINYTPTSMDIQVGELYNVLQKDNQKKLDFEKGPLFSCKYISQNDGKKFCIWIIHHIIFDGWSADILTESLEKLLGKQTLIIPKYTYADYVWNENKQIDSERTKKRKAFWYKYASNCSFLSFNTKRTNDYVCGNALSKTIPDNIVSNVEIYCKQKNCTHFEFYYSIFNILLYRLFDKTEFLTLFMSSGRENTIWKDVVGYFVNSIPLKFSRQFTSQRFVDYFRTFRANLMETRNNELDLYTILSACSLNSQSPSICFNMADIDPEIPKYEKELHFDLTFGIYRNEIYSTYRTSCISREQIQSLTDSFLAIVSQILSDDNDLLESYDIVSDSYKKNVVIDNRIGEIKPSLSEIFLVKFNTHSHSDNLAILDNSKKITYRELDEESDLLANKLKGYGLKEGYRIATIMQRSINFAITVIAIWKCKCSYVPIDPSFPDERKNFIIHDADCYLSISENGIEIIGTNIAAKEDEAYVIYTSGTTGIPKGVPICHHNLAVFFTNMEKEMGISKSSRILQFTSITFDVSMLDLFFPLTQGATVLITPEEARHDINMLSNLLDEEKITHAYIPPVLLSMMPIKEYSHLRCLWVGGEPAKDFLLQEWAKKYKVYNLYGPTECTVWCSYNIVKSSSKNNDIGIALEGTSWYVLDKNLKLLPAGFEGELYLGGLQLTNGYIHRAELNERLFINNPYVSEEDKKEGVNLLLYKSGDRVIKQTNGHLIFRGRVDNQVKLHGYRIELGEIESILSSHTNVSNSFVRVEDEEIVAYVQAQKDVTIASLRQLLIKSVPSYMIPSKWAIMERFPVNTNGKTDFKVLKSMQKSTEQASYVSPNGATEIKMAKIWEDILKTHKISRTDNFISLGGDSLAMIRLSFKIRENFGIKIDVSSLYACDSLQSMAKIISEGKKGCADNIERCPYNVTDITLSPTLLVMWYACSVNRRSLVRYNMPLVIALPQDTTYEKFCDAFNKCVSIYDALRATIKQTSSSIPLMHIEHSLKYKINKVDVDSQSLVDLLYKETQIELDIFNGPIFKCSYITVDDGRVICSFVVHHMFFDGLSESVFTNALLQTLKNEEITLPKYNYADYVWNDNNLAKSPIYHKRKAFWMNYLSNSINVKFGSNINSSDMSGTVFSQTLPVDIITQIDKCCEIHNCTQFELCYTIFHVTLSHIYHINNFVTFFSSSGRDNGSWMDSLGYFVHPMPLRYKVENLSTPISSILKTTIQDLDKIRSNELDLITILSTIPEESLSANVVFDMFNEPLEMNSPNIDAYCDLTFGVWCNGNSIKIWALYRTAIIHTKEISTIANTFVSMLSDFLNENLRIQQ